MVSCTVQIFRKIRINWECVYTVYTGCFFMKCSSHSYFMSCFNCQKYIFSDRFFVRWAFQKENHLKNSFFLNLSHEYSHSKVRLIIFYFYILCAFIVHRFFFKRTKRKKKSISSSFRFKFSFALFFPTQRLTPYIYAILHICIHQTEKCTIFSTQTKNPNKHILPLIKSIE